MPLRRDIASVFGAIPDRIEVSGGEPTWRVTGGSFEAVLAYAKQAFGDPVVVAREDRQRWWPRVTLTVTKDPELAAVAPSLEVLAAPAPAVEAEPEPATYAEPAPTAAEEPASSMARLEDMFAYQEELRAAAAEQRLPAQRHRVPAQRRGHQVILGPTRGTSPEAAECVPAREGDHPIAD